jgi:hypothetical protein
MLKTLLVASAAVFATVLSLRIRSRAAALRATGFTVTPSWYGTIAFRARWRQHNSRARPL